MNLHFSKTIVTQCSELQVLVLGIWSYLHLLDWFNGNISLERVGVNQGTPELLWFFKIHLPVCYLDNLWEESLLVGGLSFLELCQPVLWAYQWWPIPGIHRPELWQVCSLSQFIFMGKAIVLAFGMQCYCEAIFWKAELRAAIDLEFASRFLT